MTHVSHVWASPIPDSVAQAEAILHALIQSRDVPPNPRYLALIQRLCDEHPPELESDDLDESGGISIWAEPPSVAAGGGLVTLAVKTGDMTVGLPAIWAAAHALGLVVYDTQTSEVRLPDGRGLSPTGPFDATPSMPGDNQAFTRSAALVRLRQALTPVFVAHGFKALKGDFWFVKKTKVAKFTFHCTLGIGDRLEPHFEVDLLYPQPLADASNDHFAAGLTPDLGWIAARHGLAFDFTRDHSGVLQRYERQVGDWAELSRVAVNLVALFGQGVLPLVDRLESFAEFDRLVNRVPDDDCPFRYQRESTEEGRSMLWRPEQSLALAHVTGDPGLECLARAKLALSEETTGRLDVKLRQFLARLGVPLASSHGQPHMLHLWGGMLPENWDEGLAHLKQLQAGSEVAGASPGFGLFMQRLAAEFPEPDVDADDPPSIWADGLPRPHGGLLTLALRDFGTGLATRAVLVLPALRVAARAAGLVLFDPAAGELRLPDGRGFCAGGRFEATPSLVRVATPASDERPSARFASRALRLRLQPVFERHGFTTYPSDRCFVRRTRLGTFGLAFDFATYASRGDVRVGLSMASNHAEVRRQLAAAGYANAYASIDPQAAAHHVDPRIPLPAPDALGPDAWRKTWACGTLETLQEFGDRLTQLFEGGALEFLERLQDIAELKHWLLEAPVGESPFMGLARAPQGR